MTPKEKEILKGMQGFLAFCIKENQSFSYCLGNLGHDVNGLMFEEHAFSPRTLGYAKFK